MNQFSSFSLKENKEIPKVIKDFDYILNNLWCRHSEQKGIKRWNDIRNEIPSEFRKEIQTEIGHVDIGHGRSQALMVLKSEMEKYLSHILKK